MKNNQKKVNTFFITLLELVIIPVATVILIASIIMCLFLYDNPQSGNLTIVMASISTVLAIVGIVFAIISEPKNKN